MIPMSTTIPLEIVIFTLLILSLFFYAYKKLRLKNTKYSKFLTKNSAASKIKKSSETYKEGILIITDSGRCSFFQQIMC